MLFAAGLAGGLASKVAAALELKMESQEKDDMHDNHSSDDLKSDDESERRDIKTPRGGTRTRYVPRHSENSMHSFPLASKLTLS